MPVQKKSITPQVRSWAKAEVDRQGDPPEFYEYMERAWQYAMGVCEDWNNHQPRFNEFHIHKLAGYIRGGQMERYRMTPVSFRGARLALDWRFIPRQMTLLLENQQNFEIDEFVKAFLDIHPFEDGNGRVASILWNIRNGTLDNPVIFPDYYPA